MDKQPTDKKTETEVSVGITHEPDQAKSSVASVTTQAPEVIAPQMTASEPETPWKFSGGDSAAASNNEHNQTVPASQADHAVTANLSASWSASEFVHHKKTFGWYTLLIIAGGGIAAGVYFLDHHSIFSTAVVIVAVLAFAVYANRQPRVLKYNLDHDGLTIGDKRYKYNQFRSFAITTEGAFTSIVLTPLKRFMPQLSIIFPPEDQDKITDLLADSLPMEQHKPDAIDTLMHRIRF